MKKGVLLGFDIVGLVEVDDMGGICFLWFWFLLVVLVGVGKKLAYLASQVGCMLM